MVGFSQKICSSPQHGRDCRGGLLADRCASNGAGRVPRNPGKPLKNGLLAIFSCRKVAAAFSGPSRASGTGRYVLYKMASVLLGRICFA